jgi:hypothetical protein
MKNVLHWIDILNDILNGFEQKLRTQMLEERINNLENNQSSKNSFNNFSTSETREKIQKLEK